MPQIPDIKPKIDLKRDDIINLLLASIALEEIGLAGIINVEVEKVQHLLEKDTCKLGVDDLLEINDSVSRTLREVIKKEILLEFKFENVLDLMKDKKKKCCD